MATLLVEVKLSGQEGGAPQVAVGIDENYDGHITDAERFPLAHDPGTNTWRGHKTVSEPTANMLIMVVYQVDEGAELHVVVTKDGTKKVWDKKRKAMSNASDWMAGYLWY